MKRATVEIVTYDPADNDSVLEIVRCLRASDLQADYSGCDGGGTLTRFEVAEAQGAEAVQCVLEECLAELGIEWERMMIRTTGATLYVEPSKEVEA